MPVIRSASSSSALQRRLAVILFAVSIIQYFMVNFLRNAVPGSIFNELQIDLACDAGRLANLAAAFTICHAFGQIIVGPLADRYGGCRVIQIGGFLIAFSNLLFCVARTPFMLAASRALCGVSCSCIYLSIVKECDRFFSDRFTQTIGFVVLCGYIGGAVATAPLVACTARWGWRNCFLVLGLFILAISILYAVLARQATPVPVRPTSFPVKTYVKVLTNTRLLRFFLSYPVNYALYYTIQILLGKKFLEEGGGMSSDAAAICLGILIVYSAVANPVLGMASVWFHNRRRPFYLVMLCAPLVCFSLIIAAILAKGGQPGLVWLFFLAYLCGASISAFSPIAAALGREYNTHEEIGVVTGLINAFAFGATAFFSSLAGIILNRFHDQAVIRADGAVIYPDQAYIITFAIFLAIAVLTFFIGISLPETNGHDISDGRPMRGHLAHFFRLHT